MWRAVRSAKGAFSSLEIIQLSRVDRSSVSKYLRHLEDTGLIRRSGRDGNAILFILTNTGREQHKTPYPAADILNPYHAECAATAALCRILLLEDVHAQRVRQKIREKLDVLNCRFFKADKGENHAEQ